MKSKLSIMATVALVSACGQQDKKQVKNNAESKVASTTVRCFGINSCEAHAQCAVTRDDVEATKKNFGEKFAQTEIHECKGHAKCGQENGQLNWVQVAKSECAAKKGFTIEDGADGKKTVVTL